MKIEVEYCTNTSKGQGTISATLNDNAIGNSFTVTKPQSGGTTLKTATLFEDATGLAFNGNLVVSTIATENSIYIYQVRVYYEEIAAKAYDVTVTQAEGGTITASPVGEKVVDAGDKITVTIAPDERTDEAVKAYGDYIARQVLATSITVAPVDGDTVTPLDMDGWMLPVIVEKA